MRSTTARDVLRRRRIVLIAASAVVALVALWLWRPPPPPTTPEDLCSVYRERLSWYRDSRTAARRWDVTEPVLLSILVQESGLRAISRPPRRRFLGFLPGRRPSSAYGYAQVVDATWRQFEEESGRSASRRRFADAVDFVGWYARELRDTLGLSASQVEDLYLAYHEGPGGYRRGSHRAKAALQRSARRVATRAERYGTQLRECRHALDRSLLWRDLRRFLAFTILAIGLLALGWWRLRR